MEIVNYEALLANANAVKALVNKTIECSKDYTDSHKDGILRQMIEYLHKTLQHIASLDLETRKLIISYIRKYMLSLLVFEAKDYLINGLTATIRIKFDKFDGDLVDVYLTENCYWFEREYISDKGLKFLINRWQEIKKGIDAGIREAMDMINRSKESQLKSQLALHEAIKNFQV